MIGIIITWVKLQRPRIEDGNNFGVEVQMEVLGSLETGFNSAKNVLDTIPTAFFRRGGLVRAVEKHVGLEDYVSAVTALDEKQLYEAGQIVADVQMFYSQIMDKLRKNWSRVENPKGTAPQAGTGTYVSSFYSEVNRLGTTFGLRPFKNQCECLLSHSGGALQIQRIQLQINYIIRVFFVFFFPIFSCYMRPTRRTKKKRKKGLRRRLPPLPRAILPVSSSGSTFAALLRAVYLARAARCWSLLKDVVASMAALPAVLPSSARATSFSTKVAGLVRPLPRLEPQRDASRVRGGDRDGISVAESRRGDFVLVSEVVGRQ